MASSALDRGIARASGQVNLTRSGPTQSGRLTGSNIARTLTDAHAVWKASQDADLVHIHTALVPHVTMIRTGLLACAARLRRRRTIVHVHGGRVVLWLRSGRRRLFTRVCLIPADRVVAVSDGVGAVLSSALGSVRVAVIGNGVDVERFGSAGARHDPPRILYAGVVTPRKGLLDLFAASETLRGDGIPHEVIVAGGTPDEGPEAEAAVNAAAGEVVRFVGPQQREDMAALYREADLFCLPSWWEAMPLSLLEAMASGLPVVATRVGEIPRIVESGVSGLLVPPRDPDALAEALRSLLQDPDLRAAMGVAGRRRVEAGYTLRHVKDAIGELYRAVLSPG